jgi:hypothetical protein
MSRYKQLIILLVICALKPYHCWPGYIDFLTPPGIREASQILPITTSPHRRFPIIQLHDGYSIVLAENKEDIRQSCELVNDEFEKEGYGRPYPDAFYFSSATRIFNLMENGILIGTISIVFSDIKNGVRVRTYGDSNRRYPENHGIIDRWLAKHEKKGTAEVSALVMKRDLEKKLDLYGRTMLAMNLMRAVYFYLKQLDQIGKAPEYLICTVNPNHKHGRFYKRIFGFEDIEPGYQWALEKNGVRLDAQTLYLVISYNLRMLEESNAPVTWNGDRFAEPIAEWIKHENEIITPQVLEDIRQMSTATVEASESAHISPYAKRALPTSL